METETPTNAIPLSPTGDHIVKRDPARPHVTVVISRVTDAELRLTRAELGVLVQWAYDHRGLSGVPF